MKSVEELDVFKKAHELTLWAYKETEKFPRVEQYGIISQMRRACASINANLLEGSHRNTKGEFKQFVGVAKGSAGEIKYFLLLAKDLGFIDQKVYIEKVGDVDDICRMLNGLRNSLS
jgi:four helix bundle protein